MTLNAQRVLFIGLGAMGEPMAKILTEVADVLVDDVSAARREEVAARIGATAVDDRYAAATTVDVVLLMLPSSIQVNAVMRDERFTSALRQGAVVLDMSSSDPQATRELGSYLSELGIALVDAPVSGGRSRAITGELAIMVGGPAEAKKAATPLLDALGATVKDVGEVGNGHAMKALNNLLSATGLLAACEIIAVGQRFGLEAEDMLTVINSSTGRNHATEVKFAEFILSRRFDAGFAIGLMVKDLKTAGSLVSQALPENSTVSRTIDEWSAALDYLEDGSLDHTAIARWVENVSGTELRASDVD